MATRTGLRKGRAWWTAVGLAALVAAAAPAAAGLAGARVHAPEHPFALLPGHPLPEVALASVVPTAIVGGCVADASNGWRCEFPCTSADLLGVHVWRSGPANPFLILGGASCGMTEAFCYSPGGARCSHDDQPILVPGVGTCRGMPYAASAWCVVRRVAV